MISIMDVCELFKASLHSQTLYVASGRAAAPGKAAGTWTLYFFFSFSSCMQAHARPLACTTCGKHAKRPSGAMRGGGGGWGGFEAPGGACTALTLPTKLPPAAPAARPAPREHHTIPHRCTEPRVMQGPELCSRQHREFQPQLSLEVRHLQRPALHVHMAWNTEPLGLWAI